MEAKLSSEHSTLLEDGQTRRSLFQPLVFAVALLGREPNKDEGNRAVPCAIARSVAYPSRSCGCHVSDEDHAQTNCSSMNIVWAVVVPGRDTEAVLRDTHTIVEALVGSQCFLF